MLLSRRCCIQVSFNQEQKNNGLLFVLLAHTHTKDKHSSVSHENKMLSAFFLSWLVFCNPVIVDLVFSAAKLSYKHHSTSLTAAEVM